MVLPSPAAQLALDEAWLDHCEESDHPGLLYFSEPREPFIVLGYSRKVEEELHLDACRRENIPVLRRASGGGTVLQTPGCLNYTLVLPIEISSDFETISDTNCHVMRRQQAAVSKVLGREVEILGHTDLALSGRKFSGNAQRRKRRCFLFHGTFLLRMDLPLMERCLRLPPLQPEYRERRSHTDFLTTIPVSREELGAGLAAAWPEATFLNTEQDVLLPVEDRVKALISDRYGREDWNFKF